MAPVMPRYASRERAKRAFELRAQKLSWREIADQLGYRSVGAVQTAVNRHVSRERPREASAVTFEAHKAGIETRSRALNIRFAVAFQAKDNDALIALNREIARNENELAKLSGLYAPETVDITVTQTSTAIIADARERLLAVIDGEIEPTPTKEIER